jgi:hypothetical protein
MRNGKHAMTHHFMHDIISKKSKEEIICAIVQGFTCLAAQTAQNLVLEGLEDCPISVRLINDNRKQQTIVHK